MTYNESATMQVQDYPLPVIREGDIRYVPPYSESICWYTMGYGLTCICESFQFASDTFWRDLIDPDKAGVLTILSSNLFGVIAGKEVPSRQWYIFSKNISPIKSAKALTNNVFFSVHDCRGRIPTK
ncbi:hypothetical protein AG1IA_00015 [Rhizoctonia solani AG-1 IA]|uniref:Uncharacterized protein n=1 Tax=Thanatephorus cucumeris (strain AG1-IA) TaxID=983506 RepID=L8X6W7_THACA|nr:hypothetical protein AG1IA_00015 [Rhizoctonia solani AG-1 IA]